MSKRMLASALGKRTSITRNAPKAIATAAAKGGTVAAAGGSKLSSVITNRNSAIAKPKKGMFKGGTRNPFK